MTTNKPTKVVIEITPQGWTERVYEGDQVIAEQGNILISREESVGSGEGGDWHEMLPDDPKLAKAIDDLSFDHFEVASVLYDIHTTDKKKTINYIVTTQGWSGKKVTECETEGEVRWALGDCSLGALTNVTSPTGKDVSQFTPF